MLVGSHVASAGLQYSCSKSAPSICPEEQREYSSTRIPEKTRIQISHAERRDDVATEESFCVQRVAQTAAPLDRPRNVRLWAAQNAFCALRCAARRVT